MNEKDRILRGLEQFERHWKIPPSPMNEIRRKEGFPEITIDDVKKGIEQEALEYRRKYPERFYRKE